MRKIRKRVVIWVNGNGLFKIGMSALLVAMMLFLFSYELPTARTWTYWTMPLSGKVIALDAGHGGPDGGASSKSGIIEKDINLSIVLYLRDFLQQAGAVVVMTRESDTDLADEGTNGLSRRKTEDLLRRADYVRRMKADLLLSVHLNSLPTGNWSGAQTFYPAGNDGGKQLAAFIQSELRDHLDTSRVIKSADNVYLLKALQIPSALVEVGFLSNEQEARLMAQSKYQQQVADAIYRGVLRFYSGEKVGSG
ncbi:N-acetylmuramoyl-L-alanine amidase CwlD [Paenibacillus cymbidii]|uniref:N-acetylmuramoyl-L-alanine amidase CwlD n=1 Tax=Paenibacillus cymbidii TaxID=1639034 RepID=UPI00108224C8|nr:N-acetylmuramoyl-L-alanine amidase CwlD [Paenibacillus cymbidii]